MQLRNRYTSTTREGLCFLRGPYRGIILTTTVAAVQYKTKLCRQQTEVILNHHNENVRYIGQGEARHRKYKRLKLGGDQAYDRSID
jgi:hypothetical protein